MSAGVLFFLIHLPAYIVKVVGLAVIIAMWNSETLTFCVFALFLVDNKSQLAFRGLTPQLLAAPRKGVRIKL